MRWVTEKAQLTRGRIKEGRLRLRESLMNSLDHSNLERHNINAPSAGIAKQTKRNLYQNLLSTEDRRFTARMIWSDARDPNTETTLGSPLSNLPSLRKCNAAVCQRQTSVLTDMEVQTIEAHRIRTSNTIKPLN